MNSSNYFEAAKLAFRKNMTKAFTQALQQIFTKIEFKSDIIYHDFDEGADEIELEENKLLQEEDNNSKN